MPYTRFKIGLVDVETYREKRAAFLIMFDYIVGMLFLILSMYYPGPYFLMAIELVIGAAAMCALAGLEIEWLDKEYSSRMDPTKDLEDYE